MERLIPTKLNNVEVIEYYDLKISKIMAALENLDNSGDIIRA
jgi:hypothetical protein